MSLGVLEVSSYVTRSTERIVSSSSNGKAYELKICQKLVGKLVFRRDTLSRYICRQASMKLYVVV